MRWRVRVRVLGVAAVLIAMAVSGCSASSPKKATSSPAPVKSTVTSTPPVTSSPAPAPAPTQTPLSPFEKDPAVQAFRKWADVGARTVNAGHYTSPQLRSLITSYMAKYLKDVFGPDVGGYYPGPLVYQPVGVRIDDSTHRTIRGCNENNGWVESRTTHQPLHRTTVMPVDAQMVQQSGRWLLNAFYLDKHVSCRNVQVNKRRW